MESLHDIRDKKLLTQRAKYKAQPTNKMHSRINDPNKGRLKRSSFSRESKLTEQGNQSMLGIKNITPLETHAPTPPWEEEPNIIIHSHITNIESKSKYLDLELKELTCTYLDKNFPGEEWIRV